MAETVTEEDVVSVQSFPAVIDESEIDFSQRPAGVYDPLSGEFVALEGPAFGTNPEIRSVPYTDRGVDVMGMEFKPKNLVKGLASAAVFAGNPLAGAAATPFINAGVEQASNVIDEAVRATEQQGMPGAEGFSLGNTISGNETLGEMGAGVVEGATGLFGGKILKTVATPFGAAPKISLDALKKKAVDDLVVAINPPKKLYENGKAENVFKELGELKYFEDIDLTKRPFEALRAKVTNDLSGSALPTRANLLIDQVDKKVPPSGFRSVEQELRRGLRESLEQTHPLTGVRFLPSSMEQVQNEVGTEIAKIKSRFAEPYLEQLKPLTEKLDVIGAQIKKSEQALSSSPFNKVSEIQEQLGQLRAEQARLFEQAAPLKELADNPPISFTDKVVLKRQFQETGDLHFDQKTNDLTATGRAYVDLSGRLKTLTDNDALKFAPDELSADYLVTNTRLSLLNDLSKMLSSGAKKELSEELISDTTSSRLKKAVNEGSKGLAAGLAFSGGNLKAAMATSAAFAGKSLVENRALTRSALLKRAARTFDEVNYPFGIVEDGTAGLMNTGIDALSGGMSKFTAPQPIKEFVVTSLKNTSLDEYLDAVAQELLKSNGQVEEGFIPAEVIDAGGVDEAYSQAANILAPAFELRDAGDELGFASQMSSVAKQYPQLFPKPMSGIAGEVPLESGLRVLPMEADRELYRTKVRIAHQRNKATIQEAAKAMSAINQPLGEVTLGFE